MLSNYEASEGSLLSPHAILDEAKEVNENIGGAPLGRYSLGVIVKELWADQVKIVNRGPRNQRSRFFLNLARKSTPSVSRQKTSSNSKASNVQSQWNVDDIKQLQVPNRWTTVIESSKKITFIRNEKWAYKGQRMTTEFSIFKTDPGKMQYTISAHGCQVHVESIVGNACFSDSLRENVITVLELLEKSNMCLGFTISEDEAVMALGDNEFGDFRTVPNDPNEFPVKTEKRAFSSNCAIFANGACCVNCQQLKDVHVRRNKRKREVVTIHKNTNKRYLSNEEVSHQLKEAKRVRINAENRAKYWRDKFNTETVTMDDEDHHDLYSMLSTIDTKDVPENMTCLWQQVKLFETKKNGYRWRPK